MTMPFSWTPHRFSGGALALDVANSVILRFDPQRRADRFADPAQMDGFAPAAMDFCAERALFGQLLPVAPENRTGFLRLREAIDGYFRDRVLGADSPAKLADLLEAIAAALRAGSGENCLDSATARSALRLVGLADPERLKICGNCGWLFVDRSRNRSRTWCDMAVCGNRIKANLHYRRKKGALET